MATDPLDEMLLVARKHMVDLERHLDNAALRRDVTEVGRAWVRAAQIERALREALPPDVAASALEAIEEGRLPRT